MKHDELKLFLIMQQLLNSSFPVGGFSHSNGLEYYVQNKLVCTGEQLRDFLSSYFINVLSELEGTTFLKAYDYGERKQIEKVRELDEAVYAMKLSKENRSASFKIGKAFYRMLLEVFAEEDISEEIKSVWTAKYKVNINYCVIAGYCCGLLQVNKEQALTSFFFYSLNNILQAGIKLIPLGQSEGQHILYHIEDEISEVVLNLLSYEVEALELCNFAPLYDIASMNHEFLYSKLYMS